MGPGRGGCCRLGERLGPPDRAAASLEESSAFQEVSAKPERGLMPGLYRLDARPVFEVAHKCT